MTEASIPLKTPRSIGRIARSKLFLIALMLAVVAPVLWFSSFHSAAQTPVPCETEYDNLVKQAKQELIDGNRPAAINSLIAARSKLRDCETPTAKDVAPLWPN
jgi:hypothetical protein